MELRDIRAALGYSDDRRFTTRADLMKAFGASDRRTVNRYLDGLEAIDGKHYLISDIAKRLKALCK
jgi:hypothetical protein